MRLPSHSVELDPWPFFLSPAGLTPRVPEDTEGGHPLCLLGREGGGVNVVVLGAGEAIWRWWIPFIGECLKPHAGQVFRAMVSS